LEAPLKTIAVDHPAARAADTSAFTRLAAIFVLLVVLAWVPVLSTTLPPLFDYPNHLARMHILAQGGASAVLDQYYAIRWAALPNLAMDLVVPSLSYVMPLEIAGRVFLLMTLALIAGGTVWLHRMLHGRWSLWPLAGFLLLYNRIFLWGFLNYLFGVGVALCGLALWFTVARRPVWQRVVVSSAVALIAFFSHIMAFGVYALVIAGFEAGPALRALRAGQWRRLCQRLAVAGVQFVVPCAIFIITWQKAAGGPLGFGKIWRKLDLLFSVFDNYNRAFDVACFALFVGLLLGLAATKRLGLAPVMRGPLALISAVYLMLPSQLFSGSGADHRLPLVIFLLIIAGSAPRFPSRNAALAVGVVLSVMLATRMAVIERIWLQADRVYAEDVAALDALPTGAKLAVASPSGAVHVVGIPEIHLPTLAVARRDAFVPTMFVYAAQQPVAFVPPYDALAREAAPETLWAGLMTGDADKQDAVRDALNSYDFVVFIDRRAMQVPTSPCLQPIYQSATFQLFAIDHQVISCHVS
jgi:hypothetical protein